MNKIFYLTRVELFSAAHSLNNKNLTAEENKKIYGKCNNVHGHNYKVEITVKGPIDPVTGMVIDLKILQKYNKDIFEQLDHKNLVTDVDYFKNVICSSENLAVFIWDQLEKKLEADGITYCKLHEVKVFESYDFIVSYRGEN